MNQHRCAGVAAAERVRRSSKDDQWFNGSGYPDGIEGRSHIPQGADPHHRRCLRGHDELAAVPPHPRAAASSSRSSPASSSTRKVPCAGSGWTAASWKRPPDGSCRPAPLHLDDQPADPSGPATPTPSKPLEREAPAGLGRCFLAPSSSRRCRPALPRAGFPYSPSQASLGGAAHRRRWRCAWPAGLTREFEMTAGIPVGWAYLAAYGLIFARLCACPGRRSRRLVRICSPGTRQLPQSHAKMRPVRGEVGPADRDAGGHLELAGEAGGQAQRQRRDEQRRPAKLEISESGKPAPQVRRRSARRGWC